MANASMWQPRRVCQRQYAVAAQHAVLRCGQDASATCTYSHPNGHGLAIHTAMVSAAELRKAHVHMRACEAASCLCVGERGSWRLRCPVRILRPRPSPVDPLCRLCAHPRNSSSTLTGTPRRTRPGTSTRCTTTCTVRTLWLPLTGDRWWGCYRSFAAPAAAV